MRTVYEHKDTGEFFVRVESGYMEDFDYIEGGRVEQFDPAELREVGKFTNAQIANFEHREDEQ